MGGARMFRHVVGLIWFCNAFDYPLIVGGKPMFSAPMTFVPSYIMLIMGGAVGALVGMLGLNQLPRLHHPLLFKKRFELVSRDKFFIVIGAKDEKFCATETHKLLESLGGAQHRNCGGQGLMRIIISILLIGAAHRRGDVRHAWFARQDVAQAAG